jgi:hypothetical protein
MAEEIITMMMNTATMDALTREWREMVTMDSNTARKDILERRRQATLGGGRHAPASGATSSGYGGGVGRASGELGDSGVA